MFSYLDMTMVTSYLVGLGLQAGGPPHGILRFFTVR